MEATIERLEHLIPKLSQQDAADLQELIQRFQKQRETLKFIKDTMTEYGIDIDIENQGQQPAPRREPPLAEARAA